MVEINNQRKAFLDMLAWSEGTDNGRQKTRNHGYDVIVGGELFTDYSDHPRKLVTLNPKTQINRRRTLPASFRWWDAYRKQLGLKDFSRKVRTLWHCSRLRSVALYLWLIVVINASGNRPLQQYLGFTAARALVMVSSSIRLTAWLQIQRSGRNGQGVDVWAESPRLSPLWLSASSSACHGLLIITVITPLPTKPSATKMPENWSWQAAITDMQMRQRDVAALDAKYTKELADAKKLKMMLCVMMLVVVGCTSKQSVSQCVKPPPPPAWIMQPPPDWQTPLDRIISPSERGWSLNKTAEGTRSILMSSADRVAHIDGQLMQLLWAIHTRFQRSINA